MPVDHNADTVEYPVLRLSGEATGPGPASARARVEFGALSHPGKVRANNEDCYLVTRLGRGLETLLTNLPPGHVPARFEEAGYGMLVADGMGGMAAGEVASRLAVSTLVHLVLSTPDWILPLNDRAGDRLLQRLTERYREIDAALKREARSDPSLFGMGTTMTLAYSLGSEIFLAHAGDSRAYFLRGGVLHQLTRDHTYAQALADTGVILPEEVGTHRLRHILTRALGGTGDPVTADVQRARLGDGDQVLLCTDGLSEMVDDEAIGALLRQSATAQEACEALVEAALDRGGKDNVTVVLARYRFG
jgi:PPM family protein phosphatase